MFSSDPAARQHFITGLRALADYLQARPDMPVPHYGATIHICASDAEDGGQDEIRHMAQCLDAPVSTGTDGSVETRKTFGSVTYLAFAMTRAAVARSAAQRSYYGSVIPDEAAADA